MYFVPNSVLIGSWSMSIYCMYTMASDCVNRLNTEGHAAEILLMADTWRLPSAVSIRCLK